MTESQPVSRRPSLVERILDAIFPDDSFEKEAKMRKARAYVLLYGLPKYNVVRGRMYDPTRDILLSEEEMGRMIEERQDSRLRELLPELQARGEIRVVNMYGIKWYDLSSIADYLD